MSTDKTDSGWRKRQIALDKNYEVHSCSPFCDRPLCVAEAVQAEREKFCAALRQLHDSYSLASNPNGIRARGQA